jgi:hypothetical protein
MGKIVHSYNHGNGNGDGHGSGHGSGHGYGSGRGYGHCHGYGYSDGYGDGDGNGNGDGDGYGHGYGYGYGYGHGNGYGDGNMEILHKTPIMAWHFVNPDKTLRYDIEGKKIVAVKGLVINHHGDISMCNQGLHASIEKSDANNYLTNGIATKVACSGKIIFDKNKLVCSRREILEILDP